MGAVVWDLRCAVRQWTRAPLVAGLGLLSLTLGIGANSALFTLVDAVHLRTLPILEPDRFVNVVVRRAGVVEVGDTVFPASIWERIRDRQTILERVTAAGASSLNLSRAGEARFAYVLFVSGSFFDVVGVQTTLGRPLMPHDDAQGAIPVAVVGYSLWQREFGGRLETIGQTIALEGQLFEIVGVAPASFFGLEVGRRVDVFVPIAAQAGMRSGSSSLPSHSAWWLQVFGRLRPGQTVAQAAVAFRAWQPALREPTRRQEAAASPEVFDPLDVVPAAHGTSALRRQFGTPLLILLGVVGIVLGIACGNLSTLMLARFSDRQYDFQVRRALGATEAQLVRSQLLETLLLSTTGAVLGVAFAVWLVRLAVPFFATPLDGGIQPYLPISPGSRLIAVAALLALVTGLGAGLGPAIGVCRTATLPLAGKTRNEAAHTSIGLLQVLVVAQVALSIVLLSAATLLIRSFLRLNGQPTAVDRERVLLLSVSGTLLGPNPSVSLARLDALASQLEALPGVDAASASTYTPLSGLIMLARIEVPGYVSTSPRDVNVSVNRVMPGFFDVFGTRVLLGRAFDSRDGPATPRVAIVNTAFAERYIGTTTAVGRMIKLNGQELQVVGVVATGKYKTLREPTMHFVYVPLPQWLGSRPQPIRFAIRGNDPEGLRVGVLKAIQKFDRALAVEFRTLDDEIATSVNRERVLAWVAGTFAMLALTIATLGLYGTFAYRVMRRRREIGVRMALGADRTAVLRLVLRDAAVVLVTGCVLGLIAAIVSGRVIESVLFGVDARDVGMLGLALGVMTATAGTATYFPARRAANLDPMVGLRQE
jgi:predicted permease